MNKIFQTNKDKIRQYTTHCLSKCFGCTKVAIIRPCCVLADCTLNGSHYIDTTGTTRTERNNCQYILVLWKYVWKRILQLSHKHNCYASHNSWGHINHCSEPSRTYWLAITNIHTRRDKKVKMQRKETKHVRTLLPFLGLTRNIKISK